MQNMSTLLNIVLFMTNVNSSREKKNRLLPKPDEQLCGDHCRDCKVDLLRALELSDIKSTLAVGMYLHRLYAGAY